MDVPEKYLKMNLFYKQVALNNAHKYQNMWYDSWCQMGWFQYFYNGLSLAIFRDNSLYSLLNMVQ